jgi:hypothetical protein
LAEPVIVFDVPVDVLRVVAALYVTPRPPTRWSFVAKFLDELPTVVFCPLVATAVPAFFTWACSSLITVPGAAEAGRAINDSQTSINAPRSRL